MLTDLQAIRITLAKDLCRSDPGAYHDILVMYVRQAAVAMERMLEEKPRQSVMDDLVTEWAGRVWDQRTDLCGSDPQPLGRWLRAVAETVVSDFQMGRLH